MEFDNDLVVGKLRRWEKYLAAYRLPAWEQIPDLGLYMEQVVLLLRQYLDYLLPGDLPEDEVRRTYDAYVRRHQLCAQYFIDQVRLTAAAMFDREVTMELAVRDTPEMITSAAILSGFARLFAEKLLLLEGKTLATGGSIEVRT